MKTNGQSRKSESMRNVWASFFESKWHEAKFKKIEGGDYGRFGNISGIHGNLVITFSRSNLE
jgi:hypothetical protein